MTNTNNINMTGIHEASYLTLNASFDLGRIVDVFYRLSTGEVLAFLRSRVSRCMEETDDRIYIDSYDSPLTPQQLADNVRGTLDFIYS